jgi:hypothetical protein
LAAPFGRDLRRARRYDARAMRLRWSLLFGAATAVIGAAAPGATAVETTADEAQRPEADAHVTGLGRVTYAAASVDLPISARAAFVPAAELLHLTPVASDPRRELHPYLGAGLSASEADDWDWEVAALFGPRAAGVASAGASAEVTKGLRTGAEGADTAPAGATRPGRGRGGRARMPRPAPRPDPDWELSLAGDVTLYSWQPASPVGRHVVQLLLQAEARGRLSARLRLRLTGMLFAYDRSLAPRVADDVDALGILARVGTYAPRAFAGARMSWNLTEAIGPVVEVGGVVYAAGVGAAARVAAGVHADLARSLRVSLLAGMLHNRLAGVAAALDDQRTVPLIEIDARVLF